MGAVPETSFSGNGIKPWHGRGNVVQGLLTAEEALVASGLDWRVELQPIFDADMNSLDGFFTPTRADNGAHLGVVGSRYHVIQNVDAFDFVDALIADGSAKFETAGSLFGGKAVYLQAVLPDDVIVGGDVIKPYVLFKTAHDGSGACKVLTTPQRVVCENTLNMALDSAVRSFSIRHTRNYETKLKQAQNALEITRKYYTSFVEFAEKLLAEKFAKSEFDALLDSLLVVPTDEGRGRTLALAERSKMLAAYNADDLENIRGTKFGAYNAIADYADHARRLVGDPQVRLDNAFVRTFEGTDVKDKALALLTS